MKKPFKIQGLLLITMGIIVVVIIIKLIFSEKLSNRPKTKTNIGVEEMIVCDTIKKGIYENKKDIPVNGSITLKEDGQYKANLGMVISYMPMGSYRQDGDNLICYNGDEVLMKFKIDGDILIYDGGLQHFEVGEKFYLKGE